MPYRKLAISWFGAAMLVGCSSEVANLGSYIVSDDDTAFMVQIASIEKGRVNGSMSVVTSDENGKTSAVTRPLTGTIENNALNLSVENGTDQSLATGAIEGENLRLTFFANGKSMQLNFAKSDAGKFEELVNAKRHHAAEKRQDVETAAAMKGQIEQRSKKQKSIDQLSDTAFAKAQEIQEKSRKTEVVIAEYHAAYARAAKMQNAKRALNSQSPEAEYRVSQIDYELDNLSNGAEGIHSQVLSYMQSLSSFATETASRSSQFLAECQADNLLNCSRLSAGLQTFQMRNQQFQGVFARENAAFKSKN